MEIQKNQTQHGYIFELKTSEGIFYFSYAGNLDLYFTSFKEGKINTFTIDDEDYQLYLLFDELYQGIINYGYLRQTQNDEEYFNYMVEIEENREERLLKNNVIEWHCDDHDYNSGCILTIKKEDKNYILTIDKTNNKTMFGENSVRIRNSGSRYNFANIQFMKLYNDLKTYEKNDQISIDEYLYKVKSKRL